MKQLDIDGLPLDTPELRLSELLDEYRELREQRLKGESKRKQAAAALLISGLQQRLLSSVEAFARTLRVHRRTVKRHWEEAQASKPEPEEGVRQSSDQKVGLSVWSPDERPRNADFRVPVITMRFGAAGSFISAGEHRREGLGLL